MSLATPVLVEFHALPYQGFTCCARCREFRYCAGLNLDSRVCPSCWEFVFKQRAPNMRRRKAPK